MADQLALVHDYLTQRGGAERVVAAWCDTFPEAPLYTTLYDPGATFERFASAEVRTSVLNHLTPLRHHHRWAFPLLAPTVSGWRIDADTVLASSSGWAHGVRTSGRLVVYCHAPARWLYQSARYFREGAHGTVASLSARALTDPLRIWDRRAARRADRYLANSTFTAQLVGELYGLDAEVIPPPVRTPPATLSPAAPVDVLVVARLLPYKNVDLALATAARTPELRYRVVGDGPLAATLRAAAPANVEFVGAVGDDALWGHYASASVHLALSHEDFGITPLEAAMVGVPTVARRSGGYLDTITDATGVLVDEPSLDAHTVAEAVRDARGRTFDPEVLRAHAATFGVDAHAARICAALTA